MRMMVKGREDEGERKTINMYKSTDDWKSRKKAKFCEYLLYISTSNKAPTNCWEKIVC